MTNEKVNKRINYVVIYNLLFFVLVKVKLKSIIVLSGEYLRLINYLS